METFSYEVIGTHESSADCSALLYAPLESPATFRHSTRYEFDANGGTEKLTQFVRRTLVDAHAQELHPSIDPSHCAISGHDFFLEIGMKAGALDNEKESIMQYYRSLDDPGFQIDALRIFRRYYIFGSNQTETFVRDMCNPAVNAWRVG